MTATDPRPLLDALREDIDDALTWSALMDWLDETSSHPCQRDQCDSACGRAHLLLDVFLRGDGPGRDHIQSVEMHSAYAEPGYTDPADGAPIAVGDWNAITHYQDGERVVDDDAPARLADLLERLGCALEWSDEWASCSECDRLVRTQPDCYSWHPSYHYADGAIECAECYAKHDPNGLDEFVAAYVECALWSSTDDQGEPLDGVYTDDDLAPVALASMREDCAAFLRDNERDIGDKYARAGHDFWLTRNRHGAGFWDGDWPHEIGRRLTDAAHVYGGSDLYIGDDGMLHLQGE